ncbi:hypothetical protein V8E51_001032 [Hyaloscypha variabilis]
MPHETIFLLLLSTGLSQAPLHTGRNILTHDPQTVRRITIQPYIISNHPNNLTTRELRTSQKLPDLITNRSIS